MTENKVKKRKRGRPSKAQRLEDFSILNWRAELFLMISDELADIKKRELSIMKDDDDGYAKQGGSGGQSEKAGKISMALEHSKSLIEGAIRAIDKTKKEADLEEKLKEAERDKKKLESALKRIEKEETKKEDEDNGDN
ncbi:MAG: hypothetical protein B655_1593 [Methanobacterium sp. Maddingley MBC34]|nr:MAG: hypothetical protein B655_1593 [Methanobacterium sp. Maddingley MBC34]